MQSDNVFFEEHQPTKLQRDHSREVQFNFQQNYRLVINVAFTKPASVSLFTDTALMDTLQADTDDIILGPWAEVA